MAWLTECFPDDRIKAKYQYTMEQVAFSGILVFLTRYRSLRSFCIEHKGNHKITQNKNSVRYAGFFDPPRRRIGHHISAKSIITIFQQFGITLGQVTSGA